jgi:hypothetical protein
MKKELIHINMLACMSKDSRLKLNNLSVGKKNIVDTYSNEQFTTWKITKRETTVIITRPEANNRKPPQQRK